MWASHLYSITPFFPPWKPQPTSHFPATPFVNRKRKTQLQFWKPTFSPLQRGNLGSAPLAGPAPPGDSHSAMALLGTRIPTQPALGEQKSLFLFRKEQPSQVPSRASGIQTAILLLLKPVCRESWERGRTMSSIEERALPGLDAICIRIGIRVGIGSRALPAAAGASEPAERGWEREGAGMQRGWEQPSCQERHFHTGTEGEG